MSRNLKDQYTHVHLAEGAAKAATSNRDSALSTAADAQETSAEGWSPFLLSQLFQSLRWFQPRSTGRNATPNGKPVQPNSLPTMQCGATTSQAPLADALQSPDTLLHLLSALPYHDLAHAMLVNKLWKSAAMVARAWEQHTVELHRPTHTLPSYASSAVVSMQASQCFLSSLPQLENHNLRSLHLSPSRAVLASQLHGLTSLINLETLHLQGHYLWRETPGGRGLTRSYSVDPDMVRYLAELTQVRSMCLRDVCFSHGPFTLPSKLDSLYLSRLSHLHTLRIESPHGLFAHCLVALTNLHTLRITDSDIGIGRTHHVAGLSGLVELVLIHASLVAKDAAHIAQLTNLKHLNLSHNELGLQGLQHLMGLTNLQALNVASTNITQQDWQALDTPWQEFTSLTGLLSLDVGSNHLGPLGAQSLTGLTGLTALYCAKCLLESDAAVDAVCSLTTLQQLDISDNNIGGACAHNVSQLTRLTCLEVVSANLGKQGIEWLAALPKLQALNLRDNFLNGPAMQCLARLTNLCQLNLAYNEMNGQSMVCLTNLTRLNTLDVSYNFLGGVDSPALPHLAHFTCLTCLKVVGIAASNASQPAPIHQHLHALTALTQLQVLDIAKNDLVPRAMHHLSQLTSLRELDLSWHDCSHGLEGSVQWLSNLRQLSRLRLARCGLMDFKVSRLLLLMPSLRDVDLSGNKLMWAPRALPFGVEWVVQCLAKPSMSRLRHVNLSYSRLGAGALPYLRRLTHLVTLNVEQCDISDVEMQQLRFELDTVSTVLI